MKGFVHIRIDDRLIHGQVATRWSTGDVYKRQGLLRQTGRRPANRCRCRDRTVQCRTERERGRPGGKTGGRVQIAGPACHIEPGAPAFVRVGLRVPRFVPARRFYAACRGDGGKWREAGKRQWRQFW